MKVHIFDVDFTIVRCSTVRAFILRGLREGLVGPSIGFYLPLLSLRYGLKGYSGSWDQRAYPFMQGVPQAELQALASSSFTTILEPIARHLGISDIVASELEFRDGASTGRVTGEPAFGEGKRSRALAYLRTIGVEPGECSFYCDSHRDLPLLREVGEAVAVNPDARLRRDARARGWEILTTMPAHEEGQYA